MITTVIVSIVFISVLPVLLWTPIRLKVITVQNTYSLTWGGILSGRYVPDMDTPNLELRFLGIRRTWTLESVIRSMMRAGIRKAPEPNEPDAKRNGPLRKTQSKKWFRRLQKLIDSVHVRVLRMTLDTDDYVLNGLLYPLAVRNTACKRIDINFQGANELELELDMRPITLLKAWMT